MTFSMLTKPRARLAVLVLLGLPFLSGCYVTRTHTLVPGAGGVVVDLSSGKPLPGVTVSEASQSYPPSYRPKTQTTSVDGSFDFPPLVAGQVKQLMAPGAGVPVSRTLVFEKKGFVQRRCQLTDLSLFSEPRKLSVGLVALDTSNEAGAQEMPFVTVSRGVACSASQADTVTEYEGQPRLDSVQVK